MDFGVRMLDRKNLNWCTPFFAVSQCVPILADQTELADKKKELCDFRPDQTLKVLFVQQVQLYNRLRGGRKLTLLGESTQKGKESSPIKCDVIQYFLLNGALN